MSLIRDMYHGMQNKTLKVGTRFAVDSFQCTDTALGKVTFKWEHPDGENAVYELEMLTDLDIPRITRPSFDLSMSGCLNYNEKDKITGRDIKCKVKFRAEFEYQSDGNFHVVQFKRVPEKSETTSGWVFEWYNEGMMYLTGEGFPKDRDKAIEMFRRAADQDHPGAKNMLAKLDASDGKEIEDTLNSNNAEKMYQLGEKFRDNCEYEKADKLHQQAAKMGHVGAIFRLGERARFRDKDYAKAFELFTKAAEQGHAEAQNELGDMYFYGHGIPIDKEKAGYWYRKAAPQGIENAQRKIDKGLV